MNEKRPQRSPRLARSTSTATPASVAARSACAGPIPGRSETRRERDARARAQRAEGLGGAER